MCLKRIKVGFYLWIGLLISTTVFAQEWDVDTAKSQLNFVSIKKGTVGEVHQFKQISGKMDASGHFTLHIDLTSVDTHIPIRDQRIKQYLFEVTQFAEATLHAQIDPQWLKDIAEGSNALLQIDAALELHGQRHTIPLSLIVTRLASGQFFVVSAQPVLLNAKDWSLAAGIDKLRALAKLPSISYVVPVTFYLTLNLKH